VEGLLKEGQTWVLEADIKGYFDNIPQDRLMALIRQRISDQKLLNLIEAFLNQGLMESGRHWQPTGKGTPQGAVLSPLLANLYLHPLDQLAERLGWRMTRSADDFIVQCQFCLGGLDHQRYPKAFFERRGLISLYALALAKRTSPATSG